MYTPLADSRIYDLVVLLYTEKWPSSISKIRQLLDTAEASRICKVLIVSAGWRERVVAAKIIAAFGLSELVAALIGTFSENPEANTARAFAKLVATTAAPELRDGLLGEFRDACPATPYGKNMSVIIAAAAAKS